MGEVEVYTDCKGTLQTAVSGPRVATAARCARAHFWGPIFCRWEEGFEGVLRWTKGHATPSDVDAGRSTHWERAANAHADKFAKDGARLHGFTDELVGEVRALLYFLERVAMFLGEMAAFLVDAGLVDHDDLEATAGRAAPAAKARASRKAPALAELLGDPSLVCPPASAPDLRAALGATQRSQLLLGHRLRVAPCRPPLGGAVMLCLHCGGYSSGHRVALLRQPCRGRVRTHQAGRRRVELFEAGRHPVLPDGRLGQPWKPPLAVASWLLDQAGQGTQPRGLGAAGAPGAAQHRAALLAAVGLDEADLRELVKEHAETRGGAARADAGADEASDEEEHAAGRRGLAGAGGGAEAAFNGEE